MRIGFLGTGHIAAPMARALARAGHDVTVSERNAEVAAELADAGLGITVADNQTVVDSADAVFLCLRPAVWQGIVAPLSFRAGQSVVSVMAGVPLSDIAQAVAPATDLSVTIPYGFIENGGCPLPVAGDPATLTALFGDANPVLPQASEDALRHHFAASTMTTATVGLLLTASDWLAKQTGDAEAAEVYVAHLVSGFLADLPKSDPVALAQARAELATPDTLNLQMAEGLRFDEVHAVLDRISASMTDG